MTLSPKALLKHLRRDVALRSGLVSAAASLIALLLLATVFWLFLVERLENRIEDSLTARHKALVLNSVLLSDEERQIVQRFRLTLPVRDEGVWAWMDQEGVNISGSVSGLDCREGFYDLWLDVSKSPAERALEPIPKAQVDPDQHERFRFLSQPNADGCVVFGRSMYEVDETRSSALAILVWLVPLCMLPALLIGLHQSWVLRRRFIRLGRVVTSLSCGDLDARMPVEGDDDIDRLASVTNRSFDRLQESVNTLQQLTSVMAHDLRAPLNRVAIPLEEAIQSNRDGKTAVDSLEVVQDGLNDVRAIFDALLRISQIESGRRRSQFTDVDLLEVAKVLFEIYQPVVEDAERSLEFEVTGEGATTIQGDADLIQQAIVNLVENATRYAPVSSLIRIVVVRDPQHPTLIIRDNGPGLPEEERSRVLRRLYRYEGSTGGASGHGLGLSLVKAIVELHSGEIFLEDAGPGLLVRTKFNTAV